MIQQPIGCNRRRLANDQSLRTSEFQDGADVAGIGSAKSLDVTAAELSWLDDARTAPGKCRPALTLGQDIRHDARMAAIAVGKRMNPNQAMMKADGDFVGQECLVFEPVTSVPQQRRQSLADLVMGYANVLFRGPVRPGPFPCLVKHAAVELSYIRLGERVEAAKISALERPRVGFYDVLTLPLIQFFPGGKVRYEIVLFLGRQRCIALLRISCGETWH